MAGVLGVLDGLRGLGVLDGPRELGVLGTDFGIVDGVGRVGTGAFAVVGAPGRAVVGVAVPG